MIYLYVFGFVISQMFLLASGQVIGGVRAMRNEKLQKTYTEGGIGLQLTATIFALVCILLSVVCLGFAFKI